MSIVAILTAVIAFLSFGAGAWLALSACAVLCLDGHDGTRPHTDVRVVIILIALGLLLTFAGAIGIARTLA